ncbi:MAG: hypothetical protein JMN24_18395 [gamma proteobacterium endosymbiont of Lamellibrachia anaximandri]|nr:hypothetical protein [gamma proteobacterium endosymbiont of Lamellibrachia anaximandri]
MKRERMEHQNTKRSIIDLIKIIFCSASLAIIVAIVTVYMLHSYETKSIVMLLVVNLIASHIILIAIRIMDESFIEDIAKAITLTLVMLPFWFVDYEVIDYIRCVSLSIALGAWYLVALKILSDLGVIHKNDQIMEIIIQRKKGRG